MISEVLQTTGFYFYKRWFDLIFLVAVVASALLIFLSHQEQRDKYALLGQDWDDDECVSIVVSEQPATPLSSQRSSRSSSPLLLAAEAREKLH
ncbi:Golgi pH regulator A [Coemansia sp. Cherry 401B]|nr:Golgi pH regulator A [Coemansia sp. Cherry 401B]